MLSRRVWFVVALCALAVAGCEDKSNDKVTDKSKAQGNAQSSAESSAQSSPQSTAQAPAQSPGVPVRVQLNPPNEVDEGGSVTVTIECEYLSAPTGEEVITVVYTPINDWQDASQTVKLTGSGEKRGEKWYRSTDTNNTTNNRPDRDVADQRTATVKATRKSGDQDDKSITLKKKAP